MFYIWSWRGRATTRPSKREGMNADKCQKDKDDSDVCHGWPSSEATASRAHRH